MEVAKSGTTAGRRSSFLPGKSLDEDALPRGFARRRSMSEEMISYAAAVSSPGTVDDGSGSGRRGSLLNAATSLSTLGSKKPARRRKQSRIFDDPAVTEGYNQVPFLETLLLPRGGTSISTSVGRIQFGIPPETIKDSMRLGLEIPRVYIVPVDRFCREVGPALGINLAECEFPAYFNWFVKRKKCTLVVDSADAERDLRSVFEETLLGPHEFRDPSAPKGFDSDDFDSSYPVDCRPNFFREFQFFRKNEKTESSDELTVDVLLDFVHFNHSDGSSSGLDDSGHNEHIGVPPLFDLSGECGDEEEDIGWHASATEFDLGTYNARSCSSAQANQYQSFHSSLSSGLTYSLTDSRLGDHAALNKASVSTVVDADSLGDPHVNPASAAEEPRSWVFSLVKWLGVVATVWPSDATLEQIANRSVPRVEIFKMPGGSEYIVHDVDVNNYIVGKARLSGIVEVPDELAVEGFLDSDVATSTSRSNEIQPAKSQNEPSSLPVRVPFHPPSFGVTILGNSHGFDKNGSTSGYVIWINGRGVMVDPPPYSSATLEREGIRPQTIIAIVITHCHADHDAGAFQKVLTGSRVAIITTPSIYKSFIRKYAALSGLCPGLLRRSHRFRAAIIGQPLRFQGATFHFNFTLHTIPCIALKVEWRGRSVIFTGDHLNLPPLLEQLEQSVRHLTLSIASVNPISYLHLLSRFLKGVLSKGRAKALRQLPLEHCDVLLHEAGAPPIHTPLSVLEQLPVDVRDRLFVVHTSALPADCELRVAPVGTAGTIRLDQLFESCAGPAASPNSESTFHYLAPAGALDDGGSKSLSFHGVFATPNPKQLQATGLGHESIPPLVYQRPTCVSDAWFILNLLSNIPFFSSLSYMNTMMVLEIARVELYCVGDVVVSAGARREVLCVIWEGTCVVRRKEWTLASEARQRRESRTTDVWYAGDWLGPSALQPNDVPNDIVETGVDDDVVAHSAEGVKAIFLPLADLEKILKRGSAPYRKYLTLLHKQGTEDAFERNDESSSVESDQSLATFPASDQVVDVLKCNSVLGKLPALQKRSLESIAEGPRIFEEGEALWRVGDRCDFAFLLVAGHVAFAPISTTRLRPVRNRGSMGAFVEIQDGILLEADKLLQHVPTGSEYARLETILSQRVRPWDPESGTQRAQFTSLLKADAAKTASDRFANKVLAHLYASRKYTSGLAFGRGCFLCDTSRMVSGQLVHEIGDTSPNLELHLHS